MRQATPNHFMGIHGNPKTLAYDYKVILLTKIMAHISRANSVGKGCNDQIQLHDKAFINITMLQATRHILKY